ERTALARSAEGDRRGRGRRTVARVRRARREVVRVVVGVLRALPFSYVGGGVARRRRRACALEAVGRAVAYEVNDVRRRARARKQGRRAHQGGLPRSPPAG